MAGVLCDDPEARCLEGNLFRFNAEDSPLVVEGLVNGQSTGPLPHGERMILPNTLSGTTNELALKLRGTTYPICNLNDANVTQPQDVGVLISEVPEGAPTGGSGTEQDIMVIEVPAALVSTSPGEGEIDLDTADNATLLWVATAILTTLEVIDGALGTEALFAATDGYVDLRMTGTDGAPALAEAVAFLSSRNGRAAVRAIVDGGRGALRVTRNATGALMMVARLNPGLARLLVPTFAAMARSQVATIVAGTRGQLGAGTAIQAGSRIPVVGFLIVGTINVVEWYQTPASQREWEDLFSSLVLDGTALVISAAVANAAAGFLIGVAAAAGMLTVGVAVGIAVVGLAVGLGIGMGVTAMMRHANAHARLSALTTAVTTGLRNVVQSAAAVTGSFADTLGEVVENYQEMGREIEREWFRGWDSVIRNGGLFR